MLLPLVVVLTPWLAGPAPDGPFPAIVLSHGSTGDGREQRGDTAKLAVAAEVRVP